MSALKWTLAIALALPAAVLLVGQVGWLSGQAPSDLGVRDGRLKPPSKTANSVSSQAHLWPGQPPGAAAAIAPLALRGDGATTLERIRAAALALPGARLVEQRPGYLYLQFKSRWLKFVDDTEFWVDPATQEVQVRSAARLGRRDFGVNRARVEAIRARLLADD